MFIRNVHLENHKDLTHIRIKGGTIESISPSIQPEVGEEVLEGKGSLVLPQFVESHIHLDSALTAGLPRWNQSGTLFEGIQCWGEYRPLMTKEDLRRRIYRSLEKLASHGVGHIRTHVDVSDPSFEALETLLEIREEMRDRINIQVMAFPQEGIISFPGGRKMMERAVEMGLDGIGGMPHFEHTREYGVESIDFIMELAEKHDLLVDVHCDEIDDEQSRFLETLATRALETGLKDKVTASHTTAMHSYNNAYTSRLFRLLKMSKINFIANPLSNIHLQGRFDTYPKRRGMTRVKELLAAGMNVSIGHDNFFDPFYPLGDGNLRDALHMALHIGQMMGYEEILNSYRLITYNGAKTLHLGDTYGVKEGAPASFILLNADTFYNALNEKSEVLYNFSKGKVIAKTSPKEVEVFF